MWNFPPKCKSYLRYISVSEEQEHRSIDSPSAGSDSLEGPPRGFPVYPGPSLGLEDEARKSGGYLGPRPHYSLGQQMMRQPARKQPGKSQVRERTMFLP